MSRECEDAVEEAIGKYSKIPTMAAILALARGLDSRLDEIKVSIPPKPIPDPGPFSINTETVFHKLDKEKQYQDRISALAGALRPYFQQEHDENHTGSFAACERANCIRARALLGDE